MNIGIIGTGNAGSTNRGGSNPALPYAADFDADGVLRALATASKDRKPEWRAKYGAGAA